MYLGERFFRFFPDEKFGDCSRGLCYRYIYIYISFGYSTIIKNVECWKIVARVREGDFSRDLISGDVKEERVMEN